MSRRAEEQDQARGRGGPEGLPKRWGAQRKAEVVLRLLCGRRHRRREPGGCDVPPVAVPLPMLDLGNCILLAESA